MHEPQLCSVPPAFPSLLPQGARMGVPCLRPLCALSGQASAEWGNQPNPVTSKWDCLMYPLHPTHCVFAHCSCTYWPNLVPNRASFQMFGDLLGFLSVGVRALVLCKQLIGVFIRWKGKHLLRPVLLASTGCLLRKRTKSKARSWRGGGRVLSSVLYVVLHPPNLELETGVGVCVAQLPK